MQGCGRHVSKVILAGTLLKPGLGVHACKGDVIIFGAVTVIAIYRYAAYETRNGVIFVLLHLLRETAPAHTPARDHVCLKRCTRFDPPCYHVRY